ncbi:MAG: peptide chain release factor N(5)-glutamine methyltransferase [Nitrospirota bacterium]
MPISTLPVPQVPILHDSSSAADAPLEWLSFGEARLKTAGIKDARREAEALLLALLSLNRIDLYLGQARPLSEDARAIFIAWLERRSRHEPLQYITGEVEFCELHFGVAPGVFIPRPETELIVEAASALRPKTILDICTGTGALAITLAKRFPNAAGTAIDLSPLAIETARINQKRHETNVRFLEGDLFSPLPSSLEGEGRGEGNCYDLIVCNPPYIAEEDADQMDPEVLEYEPPLALFSPDDGLAHIKKVLTDAPQFLAHGGTLMLEIGKGQSNILLDFIQKYTKFSVQIIQDCSAIDRILVCSQGALPHG